MSLFAVIIPSSTPESLHKMLSMLSFQRFHDFQVYVLDTGKFGDLMSVAESFDAKMSIRVQQVAPSECTPGAAVQLVRDEPFVLFMDPTVEYGKKAFKRMARCIQSHPDHDVYHWNYKDRRKYPRTITGAKLFKDIFYKELAFPLSSFVFRTSVLRERISAEAKADLSGLALVLVTAGLLKIRSVWWEKLPYTPEEEPADRVAREAKVRSRLAFFHWSERHFGEDYPIGVSDRLALYARELAKLSASVDMDTLKEELFSFAVVNGPIRRLKASNALKAALSQRPLDAPAEPASEIAE